MSIDIAVLQHLENLTLRERSDPDKLEIAASLRVLNEVELKFTIYLGWDRERRPILLTI